MNHQLRRAAAAAAICLSGCTYHSTATRWNGVLDDGAQPVFVKTTTSVGFNLGVLLPLVGSTSLETMIDEATAEIAESGGSRVRLVQSSTENYWYGWSPFTWIVTPVIADLVVEYTPSPEERKKAAEMAAAAERRTRKRARGDNTHVIPERR